MLIIALACIGIKLASKPNEFLKEANEFKYELIQHQDSIIQYQYNLINDMDKHLEEEHNCDNPIFDGDDYYFMKEQQQIIDSLYNTQL